MRRALLALLIGVVASTSSAAAQNLSEFGFTTHPDAPLPLTARFADENGRAVMLGDYFNGKPVILVLEYLHCQTLCGLTLAKVIGALAALPTSPAPAYELVAISIDPRDRPADAAAARETYLADQRRIETDARVHFLTGSDGAIHTVADAVGFPYRYDAALDQYIHPAGFVIATPGARISRYVYSIDPSAAELSSALEDAAQGRSPGVFARLLLLCHLRPPRGRYTLAIEAAFVIANIAGLLGAVVVFAGLWRRRRG